MKPMNLEENTGKLQASEDEVNGDHSQKISSSRFSSLLATKDRDYLLSQDGTQVLTNSLISRHLFLYIYIWFKSMKIYATNLGCILHTFKSHGFPSKYFCQLFFISFHGSEKRLFIVFSVFRL